MSNLSNPAPNAKIGQGNLRVGENFFANTLRKWVNTGSYLTYKDLTDRPDYYLRKVAEYFGVSYNENVVKKYDWLETNVKNVQNPDVVPRVNADKLPKAPSFSFEQDQDRINQYFDAYYKLSFDHPDEGKKTTRKLRYYFTCEELQTVINEDLISGYSGYSVSSAGDIKSPMFGPYILQSNRTGINSNPIYFEENSNKHFISGSIEGWNGDVNEHSIYNLSFHKTGEYDTEITLNVSGIPDEYDKIFSEVDFQDYDIEAGYFNISQGEITSTYLISGLTDQKDYSVVLEDKETAGIIKNIKAHRVYGVATDLELLFEGDIDPADTNKKIYITGVNVKEQDFLLSNRKINPYRALMQNLVADGDAGENGYTKENFWYLNAPTGYVGHRYFHYTGIKITNCNEIKGFRIPPHSFFQAEDDLQRIECTNNPNLKDILTSNITFKSCNYIDFSGCALETNNDLHSFHDSKFYQNNTSDTGEYPYNVYRSIPDYLREPHYNGQITDDNYFAQVERGLDKATFASFRLRHLNVSSNNLNQTGCYYMIRSCLLSQGSSGYLNISEQAPRVGPESATFSAFRGNLYRIADPTSTIIDVNDACISGMNALRDAGWTIIHD